MTKNVRSAQASNGVTADFVDGHYTSKIPKGWLHLKSTTGIWFETTSPHLIKTTGVFLAFMNSWYSWIAVPSYLFPWEVCLLVKSFEFIRSLANVSWFRCLLDIRWNPEAVNLNCLCSFHSSLLAWPLVSNSISLISFSSSSSEVKNVLSSRKQCLGRLLVQSLSGENVDSYLCLHLN